MRKLKSTYLAFASAVLLISCSDNDDDTPELINEEEVITTVRITLEQFGESNTVTLTYQDLDGDGPEPPTTVVSGSLLPNQNYSGRFQILNETEDPSDDITLEIQEEKEEHQFFFEVSGAITAASATDEDEDGNPVGLLFQLSTGDAGTGTFTTTLRHEPKKPNDGTLADAGGETDVTATFQLVVEN